ncbi:MAG: 30S ribosomal protein S12 methylthiotransferase RimO [Spirochaetes bacterium]|nr:30S ribosomal protein S12 methylthiotransferase RimO [Spirochaetota bacterium]
MFSPYDISYYIISLGCPKNEVDSERLNADMHNAGFVEAGEIDSADIIFINTCGFIEEAKKESIATIFDALDYTQNKKSKFKKRVVVLGCLTQRYKEEIIKEIPEIDLVWGLYDSSLIDEIARLFDITLIQRAIAFKRKPLIENLPYAYIKIAEGCSNFCSYCAIPLIRGNFNAFPPSAILQDAKEALSRGVKELIIVAQDTAVYKYNDIQIVDLLKMLNDLEGDFWIRLMYCHPDHINERLIEALATVPKVVHYIDIPFQHASRKILQSMNRKGDAQTYLSLVQNLRKTIPDIAIRSTFMVGFPGEDENDFAILKDFVAAASLDRVGVFIYSPEEGTKAFTKGDTVKTAIKKKRYAALMKLQQQISKQRLEKTIGAIVQVLVEEKVDQHNYIGRTQYDAPEIDGIFFLTAHNVHVNDIVAAKITDTLEYDRIGVML